MNLFKSFGKFVLIGLLAISLVACGNQAPESADQPNTEQNNGKTDGATNVNKPDDTKKSESNYPTKPVSMMIPSGAGGSWDIAGRSIVKVLQETKLFEGQMPIENKPGGSGAVFLAEFATQDVKNDYKIFVTSPSMLINNLRKDAKSPFGYQDTTPLAQLFRDYGVIAVAADSKYNDLKSLFEDMKKDPSKLAIGGGSAPGSLWHLNFAIPANEYGMDLTKLKYVSFNGNGESMTALLGGHVQILSSGASDVKEYVRAGKVKVLALNAPKRLDSEEFKDVPTLAEIGINADFSIWRGVFGAKEMSPEAKAYWDAKLKEMSETPEWQAEMKSHGWEADYKSADDFTKSLETQSQAIHDVLATLGMAG